METQKPVSLLLVRHGQAQSNVSKILASYPEVRPMPLSAQGRKEVQETAKTLQSFPIDAIIASPLTRTQETAAIISQAVAVPVITDHRLRETDFGTYNNGSMIPFFLRYPHPALRRTMSKESGVEGLDEVKVRLREFLQEVQLRYAGKTVVVVTHADCIKELLGLISGEGRQAVSIATGSLHPVVLEAATQLG